MIFIDHCTVGHRSSLKSPYSAMLVGVDAFSNFLAAENVISQSAIHTVAAIKSIVEAYGASQIVKSDNRAIACSGLKNLLDSYGISFINSIPYSSSSNGKIGRNICSLENKLRTLLSSTKN